MLCRLCNRRGTAQYNVEKAASQRMREAGVLSYIYDGSRARVLRASDDMGQGCVLVGTCHTPKFCRPVGACRMSLPSKAVIGRAALKPLSSPFPAVAQRWDSLIWSLSASGSGCHALEGWERLPTTSQVRKHHEGRGMGKFAFVGAFTYEHLYDFVVFLFYSYATALNNTQARYVSSPSPPHKPAA